MTLELCMYISIYRVLMNHDRKMKLVLNPSTITKRLQKNIISLAGHSINFLVETLWALTFLSIAAKGMPKEQGQLFFIHLFELNMYGVLSFLHLIFSQPLWSDCAEIKNSVCEMFCSIFPSQTFLRLSGAVRNYLKQIETSKHL